MSTAHEYRATRAKNQQLKSDLLSLAERGDSTEFRLLREVFEIPQKATRFAIEKEQFEAKRHPRDRGFVSGAAAAAPAASASTGELGSVGSVGFVGSGSGSPRRPLRSLAHPLNYKDTERGRFNQLKNTIKEIHNAKYEIPRVTSNIDRAPLLLLAHAPDPAHVLNAHSDYAPASPPHTNSHSSPKTRNENLLLTKLKAKNAEIEALNDRINQLVSERNIFYSTRDEAQVEMLRLTKSHEKEIERLNNAWKDKFLTERESAKTLYETISKQASEIEALKSHKLKLATGLVDKLNLLKYEYNRVVSQMAELKRDNSDIKVITHSQSCDNKRNSNCDTIHSMTHDDSNEGPPSNTGSESTTQLINGYCSYGDQTHYSNKTEPDVLGSEFSKELDSTTNFLIGTK